MINNMKTNTTNKDQRESKSHTPIGRAMRWLQDYVDAHRYTEGAEEARTIINELRAVRNRPVLDELLALVAEIAKTDRGLQEISAAKIRISKTDQGAEKAA
jgi:hypothetical protein